MSFLEFTIKTGYVFVPKKHFVVLEYFLASLNSCEIIHYLTIDHIEHSTM